MKSDAEASALLDALRQIAPDGVHVGVRRLDAADSDHLLPEEAAAVSAAAPVRVREFASGRVLLRELLGTDVALPVGSDRAPVLPRGTAASLAHDRTFAVAAVSFDPGLRQVGIDIEAVGSVSSEVSSIVAGPADAPLDPTVLFVVKETVFKAWSRSGGDGLLEHHDVVVTPQADSEHGDLGRYAALVTKDQSAWISQTREVTGRIVAVACSA